MNNEQSAQSELSIHQATEEDLRLVAAIANGDQLAEHDFAVRFMPRVRAMLLARSRNPDVAADLQQDVMLEALCALRRGQLRDACRLTPFVIGIARNVLNNYFRSASRQPDSIELPDDLPDLKNAFDAAEEHRREVLVTVALSSLDPTDKKILEMTLLDGLKPGIIAQRLRLTPEVVRQRKLRATRRVVEFINSQSQKPASSHFQAGQKP
jgi:RNA polymerase sigma factor (sigma-70 family)